MHFKRHYLVTIALTGLFCTTPSLADKPQPRFSANGYASDYAVGEMDLMIPISGDRLRHTYFNPAIAYGSDNQGYADLGLGHRWIHNCKTLLGVYLFGGYTRVEHDAHLWVANPGLEAMGRRWDAHLNGYLSMGDRNYHYQDGYYYIYKPTGNQLQTFRQLTNDVFHTGNGLDLKFGYQLLSHVPLRGYIGGYYFHANEVNSIGGGALGLEYWLDDHIKSFAHYTYDNVHHSTGALGIGIELGGVRYHRSNPCIEERLTDPVERYLADLGHGSAIPGQTKHNLNGTPFIEPSLTISNIAFFSQTGTETPSSTAPFCTFENPCGPNALTVTTAQNLNDPNVLPGTKFYVNGGTYNNADDSITLEDGQSIHSRTADYTQPATGADRTKLSMFIQLVGDNTLENLIINTNALGNNLISTRGPNNLIIGSNLNAEKTASSGDVIAILSTGASSNSSITIENSLINATGNDTTANAYGIRITNDSGGLGTLTNIINSQINTNLSASSSTNSTYGISTITPAPGSGAQNKITLTNTKITTLHNGSSGNNNSINLSLATQDAGTALNSQFTVQSASGVTNAIVSGAGLNNMIITNGICTKNGSLSAC